MQKHPSVEQALHRRALDDLDKAREWMFLLGRKAAREKVASLLVSIAGRMLRRGPADGEKGPQQFDLPLSRNEIADSLGLTIETVSREIRYLKTTGVIATSGRRNVSVLRPAVLRALAEGERD